MTTYQKGAEDMRERCAQAICQLCCDGDVPVKMHAAGNPSDIMYGHRQKLSNEVTVAEYCPATAIRALKV